MKIFRSSASIRDVAFFAVYGCIRGISFLVPGWRKALHRRILSFRRRVYGQGIGDMRVISIEHQVRLSVDISERTGGDMFFGIGFEPLEMELLSSLVAENDVVADVGANIGVHTTIMASRTGGGGHVHAFEPGVRPYAMLCANIALNGFSNVIANRLAIGDACGKASFHVNAESSLSSLGITGRGDVVGEEEVDITTMDEYCRGRQISALDFLKIDVEGFEGHVLRGARRILAQSKDCGVLCELAKKNFGPLGYSIANVLSDVRQLGFEVWELDEPQHTVRQLTAGSSTTKAQNFLFLRPRGLKEQRLRGMLDGERRLHVAGGASGRH